MPAVCASAQDIERAQAAADADPSIEWSVDLDQMVMTGGNLRIPLEVASGRRSALREGYWDTTGMLVQNLDAARSVHARLPYTSNYK
jgi:3-isopropylmalate dehydratase small subunit